MGRKPPAPQPPANDARVPLTVTQLTARIDRALTTQIPESLLVQAEVSNINRHQASGHLYFTMKDRETCIGCVMWGSDVERMKFIPKDGMELLASGRIGVYGKQGKYQLYVSTLRPLGKGALELAFQQLRAKLEREGLFAAERKRLIPRFPTTIVLVTSREAAALADMLKVLRRFPWLRIFLYPVPVQGDGAAEKIAAALTHLNQVGSAIGAIDLIVLGRGGGSLEDLWEFNEEIVARAVAASRWPVVTGIGHEVDVSIADLVADYHAHTPTEAVQVVTAQWRNAPDLVEQQDLRLRRSVSTLMQEAQQRLAAIERHETFRRPLHHVHLQAQYLDSMSRSLLHALTERFRTSQRQLSDMMVRLDSRLPLFLRAHRERVDRLALGLFRAADQRIRSDAKKIEAAAVLLGERHPRHRLALHQQRLAAMATRFAREAMESVRRRAARLDSLEARLKALSPEAVLQRGYSITTRKRDGLVVRSAAQVRAGDRLLTRLADGQIQSVAEDSAQLPLFE